MHKLQAVSLFASSGIGDLALKANEISVIVANEIVTERSQLFKANYQDCLMINDDIWTAKNQIVMAARALCQGELDLLIATPPCQGMSKNGQGKLLAEIRAGNRPKEDPRNRLIIPTMDVAVELQPKVILLENVPEMQNTLIEDEDGNPILILDYVKQRLGSKYEGKAEVVEFANYGVPQRRQRLITIFTRIESQKAALRKNETLLPKQTHSALGTQGTKIWETVRTAIGDFPSLDGTPEQNQNLKFNPHHRVPILDPKKYEWIRHTPEGLGAFDNQCISSKCGAQDNPTHGSSRSEEGINRSKTETPLYCIHCGTLLPRPYTLIDGEIRLMKGFTSAYKRMKWDSPAPTLTTNLSYPSSDQNIHPSQNRVLSLHEALTIHTVTSFEYSWNFENGKPAKDGLIRDSIGESVPPLGLSKIVREIKKYL